MACAERREFFARHPVFPRPSIPLAIGQLTGFSAESSPPFLPLLVVGTSAKGQATTSLQGTVIDPTGKAIAAASVELANPASKSERTTTTGDQGE